MPLQHFEARVLDHLEFQAADGITSVFYVVEIEPDKGPQWNLFIRYSEFHLLYESLKKGQYQKIDQFPFPPKLTLFQDPKFVISQRKKGLDGFCKLLAKLDPLPIIVEEFLNLERNHYLLGKTNNNQVAEIFTPPCTHCGEKIQPVNGLFSGKHLQAKNLSKVHEECWEAFQYGLHHHKFLEAAPSRSVEDSETGHCALIQQAAMSNHPNKSNLLNHEDNESDPTNSGVSGALTYSFDFEDGITVSPSEETVDDALNSSCQLQAPSSIPPGHSRNRSYSLGFGDNMYRLDLKFPGVCREDSIQIEKTENHNQQTEVPGVCEEIESSCLVTSLNRFTKTLTMCQKQFAEKQASNSLVGNHELQAVLTTLTNLKDELEALLFQSRSKVEQELANAQEVRLQANSELDAARKLSQEIIREAQEKAQHLVQAGEFGGLAEVQDKQNSQEVLSVPSISSTDPEEQQPNVEEPEMPTAQNTEILVHSLKDKDALEVTELSVVQNETQIPPLDLLKPHNNDCHDNMLPLQCLLETAKESLCSAKKQMLDFTNAFDIDYTSFILVPNALQSQMQFLETAIDHANMAMDKKGEATQTEIEAVSSQLQEELEAFRVVIADVHEMSQDIADRHEQLIQWFHSLHENLKQIIEAAKEQNIDIEPQIQQSLEFASDAFLTAETEMVAEVNFLEEDPLQKKICSLEVLEAATLESSDLVKEELNRLWLNKRITSIQAIHRGNLARRRLTTQGVILIQARVRGYLSRKRFHNKLDSMMLEAKDNAHEERIWLNKQIAAVQAKHRGNILRRELKMPVSPKKDLALVIIRFQAHVRGHLSRKYPQKKVQLQVDLSECSEAPFLRQVQLISQFQARVRGSQARRLFCKLIWNKCFVNLIYRFDIMLKRLIALNRKKLNVIFSAYLKYPEKVFDREAATAFAQHFDIVPRLCSLRCYIDIFTCAAESSQTSKEAPRVTFTQFLKHLILVAAKYVTFVDSEDPVSKFNLLLKLMGNSQRNKKTPGKNQGKLIPVKFALLDLKINFPSTSSYAIAASRFGSPTTSVGRLGSCSPDSFSQKSNTSSRFVFAFEQSSGGSKDGSQHFSDSSSTHQSVPSFIKQENTDLDHGCRDRSRILSDVTFSDLVSHSSLIGVHPDVDRSSDSADSNSTDLSQLTMVDPRAQANGRLNLCATTLDEKAKSKSRKSESNANDKVSKGCCTPERSFSEPEKYAENERAVVVNQDKSIPVAFRTQSPIYCRIVDAETAKAVKLSLRKLKKER